MLIAIPHITFHARYHTKYNRAHHIAYRLSTLEGWELLNTTSTYLAACFRVIHCPAELIRADSSITLEGRGVKMRRSGAHAHEIHFGHFCRQTLNYAWKVLIDRNENTD